MKTADEWGNYLLQTVGYIVAECFEPKRIGEVLLPEFAEEHETLGRLSGAVVVIAETTAEDYLRQTSSIGLSHGALGSHFYRVVAE